MKTFLFLVLPIVVSGVGVCDPSLYDILVTFNPNATNQACTSLTQPGCASLTYPTCDMRFSAPDYFGSCSSCSAGFYLPNGPTKRICSSNGGPNGISPPYYGEQRLCRPCRTLSGICTIAGTTLEACNTIGKVGDAQCIPCTNAPSNTVYTGPSLGNLNQCPWRCKDGYYLSNSQQCVTCQTDVCPTGKYRSGCNQTSPGSCVDCTNRGVLNTPSISYYTSPGTPFDSNNCAFQCNNGYYLRSDGNCTYFGTVQAGVCTLGQKWMGGTTCLNCSSIVGESKPSNSPYSAYIISGLCEWGCFGGYYKSGGACVQCSNPITKCTAMGRGYYMKQACTMDSDVVCAPCDSFPPSMDAVATYRGPKDPLGNGLASNLCIWDCNAGYYKAAGDVPACVRCSNKPLNAEYTQVSFLGNG
jgi:hypothetical protein